MGEKNSFPSLITGIKIIAVTCLKPAPANYPWKSLSWESKKISSFWLLW